MVLHLTEPELTLLRQLQRTTTDRVGYVKVTVLILLHKQLTAQEVAEYLGIDDATVYRYRNQYQQQGLTPYLATHYKGYWGLLSSTQLAELRTQLATNLYTTSEQIAAWIQARWAIVYSPSGLRALLHRIGYSYKQTTQVPCEVDHLKQVAFMETLGHLLQQASANETETKVYFADAVHPTHNTRSTHAWIERGSQRQQPSVSGRDRVNINAVLNARDPTDVVMTECERVNAQSTQGLYEQLLAANPAAKTIYVICDNARYYKNKVLSEWVKGTPIRPVFLPAYSPNLNLIERLWKFLRKQVINTCFYRTKSAFRAAIIDFFQDLGKYKAELTSLLRLNFRLFNSQSFSF
jgi:transposase